MFVRLTIPLWLAAASLAFVIQNDEQRIVKGLDAPKGAYPYQVSMQVEGIHWCGGSIIANQWILTAGHCVSVPPLATMRVRVGSNQWKHGGTLHKVLKIIYHGNYHSKIATNDVGLLKVEPISYSEYTKPVVLDEEVIGANQSCITSGWGLVKPEQGPDNLQQLFLNTTSNEFCEKTLGKVDENEICAVSKAGQGASFIDSGGPLVRVVDGKLKQIGIVSWGKVPAGTGVPDAYARVSSHLPWIRKNCGNCV